jgi:hypothetical protein
MAEFQALMDEALLTKANYPFTTPLQFNSMVLQRYEPGQLGITPHRDRYSASTWSVFSTSADRGQFYLCGDRMGTNSLKLIPLQAMSSS